MKNELLLLCFCSVYFWVFFVVVFLVGFLFVCLFCLVAFCRLWCVFFSLFFFCWGVGYVCVLFLWGGWVGAGVLGEGVGGGEYFSSSNCYFIILSSAQFLSCILQKLAPTQTVQVTWENHASSYQFIIKIKRRGRRKRKKLSPRKPGDPIRLQDGAGFSKQTDRPRNEVRKQREKRHDFFSSPRHFAAPLMTSMKV